MQQWEINGYTLEFIPETHAYLVDGVIVPSITQILKVKFSNKYWGVSKRVLADAATRGTEVHEAIERLCKTGEVTDLKEVKNFLFLQSKYDFKVLDNEIPVILFMHDEPIAAGRLDLVLSSVDGETGLGDIKRTATLDKDYLAYQLNLYRIAYMQCYGKDITFLRGVHLRDDTRKYVNIPICEPIVWEIVEQYFNGDIQ